VQVNDVLLLYDYNYWANRRILDAAAALSDTDFLAPRNLVWGSVRNTLAHAWGAEWVWRQRCQFGAAPASLPSADDFPTLAALRARWDEEEAAMRAYLSGLDNEHLNGALSYRTTSGKQYSAVLWHILAHVVNHGTQHRAEVAQVLTDLGHSPGDVDMILYLRQRAAAM
jgi:uncharacterized damage-inducible protein DinB